MRGYLNANTNSTPDTRRRSMSTVKKCRRGQQSTRRLIYINKSITQRWSIRTVCSDASWPIDHVTLGDRQASHGEWGRVDLRETRSRLRDVTSATSSAGDENIFLISRAEPGSGDKLLDGQRGNECSSGEKRACMDEARRFGRGRLTCSVTSAMKRV